MQDAAVVNSYTASYTMKFTAVFLLLLFNNIANTAQEEFLGCYQDIFDLKLNILNGYYPKQECVQNCYDKYYRYALVRGQNNCVCTNYIGEFKNLSHCDEFCLNCDLKDIIHDVYFTGFKVLGPPTNLMITNVTDTQIHISWNPPEFSKGLRTYKVQAKSIKTYSRSKLEDLEWEFSNDTFYNELGSLFPATAYNVTVRGISDQGQGVGTYQIVETKIAVPSNKPTPPEILTRDKTTMQIRLEPVENDNGPITSYLVVVVDTNSVQTVDFENLVSSTAASDDGLTYYITAELTPEQISSEFQVGDGQIYGSYYNAPLRSSTTYDIILGVKSKLDDVEKILFSDQNSETFIYPEKPKSSNSRINLVLIIGISIVSFLIITGALAFMVIRRKYKNDYRQRLTDTQELRVQGPMIDIENHGYIADEPEGPVNHYRDLKERVWMIPHHSLNVDNTFILGQGKYGHIYKGTLEKENALINVAVYNIADRRLTREQKRNMLKDMDILIKAGKHNNILEFIGTCEHIETVTVVLEYSTLNLKEYLIGSRIPSTDKFTTLTESQLFSFAIDIANGLNYLHSKKILHNKICARHIAIVDGSIPKITGYGLTAYYKDGKSVNCTRWTAREVLKGQNSTVKSDIWSYACLLWEMCSLGATPYGSVGNHEITDKIVRGLTLQQLRSMDDAVYQLMLDCWQMSIEERPKLQHIVETLETFKNDCLGNYLNFKLYNSFEYEQFNIEQELNNSVF